jgi:DNA-binding IclR family transcriptional regulator
MRSLVRTAAVTALASAIGKALLASNPETLMDEVLAKSGLSEEQRATLKAQILERLRECEETGRPQRELLSHYLSGSLERFFGGGRP